MVEIRNKKGDVISTSRNLAGLVRKFGREPVKVIGISPIVDGGKLMVLFRNGDSCETNFADYNVLCHWLGNRRNLRGVPLVIRGQKWGKIGPDNLALQKGDEHESCAP